MNMINIPGIIFKGIYNGLNSTDRIIYGYLFSLQMQSEKNFFSKKQEDIASECCVSIRTVRRSLEVLEAYKLIECKRNGLCQPNNLYVKDAKRR